MFNIAKKHNKVVKLKCYINSHIIETIQASAVYNFAQTLPHINWDNGERLLESHFIWRMHSIQAQVYTPMFLALAGKLLVTRGSRST